MKEKKKVGHGVQAHNPHQHAGGEGRRGAICLRPAWSTYDAPGQPGLQSNTLSPLLCGDTGKTGKYTVTIDNHYYPQRSEGPLTRSDANGGGTGARGSLSVTEFKVAHSSPLSTVKCT